MEPTTTAMPALDPTSSPDTGSPTPSQENFFTWTGRQITLFPDWIAKQAFDALRFLKTFTRASLAAYHEDEETLPQLIGRKISTEWPEWLAEPTLFCLQYIHPGIRSEAHRLLDLSYRNANFTFDFEFEPLTLERPLIPLSQTPEPQEIHTCLRQLFAQPQKDPVDAVDSLLTSQRQLDETLEQHAKMEAEMRKNRRTATFITPTADPTIEHHRVFYIDD